MSPRERWIVYPLLLMTLGIALRNQFLPTRRFGAMDLRAAEIAANTVRCNELVVMQRGECEQLDCSSGHFRQVLTDLAQCDRVRAGGVESRSLVVAGSDGRPLVIATEDADSRTGLVQTLASTGMPLVQLRAGDTGGTITAIGHGGRAMVSLGHMGDNFGVFGQLPEIGPPFPITTPWQLPKAKP